MSNEQITSCDPVDALIAQWIAQLNRPATRAYLSIALENKQTAQAVLYADAQGKPGKIKVTTT